MVSATPPASPRAVSVQPARDAGGAGRAARATAIGLAHCALSAAPGATGSVSDTSPSSGMQCSRLQASQLAFAASVIEVPGASLRGGVMRERSSTSPSYP
jgi:hypothetical protein